MEAQTSCWAVGLMRTTTCISITSPSAKSSVLLFVNVSWGKYPFLRRSTFLVVLVRPINIQPESKLKYENEMFGITDRYTWAGYVLLRSISLLVCREGWCEVEPIFLGFLYNRISVRSKFAKLRTSPQSSPGTAALQSCESSASRLAVYPAP